MKREKDDDDDDDDDDGTGRIGVREKLPLSNIVKRTTIIVATEQLYRKPIMVILL